VEVREGARLLSIQVFDAHRPVAIGRAEDADIRLLYREVSRRHAVLTAREDGFLLKVLSDNGVTAPEGDILPYGSRFKVGPCTLIVQRRDDGDERDGTDDIRRRALAALVAQLDINPSCGSGDGLGPRVEGALDRILFSLGVKEAAARAALCGELRDEALGLGPLERLLADDGITEIMVVGPDAIYVEEKGRLKKTGLSFSCEDSVRTVIDRIVAPLGRRIDESSPMVDARLPDGSRVNAIIPPLALRGSAITIRRFSKTPLTLDNLVDLRSLNEDMARLLCSAVAQRQNIVISGGTGSGKTTLLNVLSARIGNDERIVTIEDAAELQLRQPHVVSLESRPANAEGRGAVTIRDLVKNALRMRPDRIIVGECRGAEALDMLQAMNTGHDGSLTTTHANSPTEAVARLETLCLMAGLNLPSRAIREQIAGAVDLIVQQSRCGDGTRRITAIAEVTGIDDDGRVRLTDIFTWQRRQAEGGGPDFCASGWMPRFLATGEAVS